MTAATVESRLEYLEARIIEIDKKAEKTLPDMTSQEPK